MTHPEPTPRLSDDELVRNVLRYCGGMYATERGTQARELLMARMAELRGYRVALESVLDAVDDLRLVNRLKEIERIATKALLAPALRTGMES